jgi:Protein of unknown function (DUF1059)
LPRFCLDLEAAFYGRTIVERLLRCDCGFEARGEDEDGLVAEVQRHAWEAHGMALSDDQALLLAFRAELDSDDRGTDDM